jgi:hypothetical protein
MASQKYHLRIIYDIDGWAFHRQVLALEKYCPPEFEISTAPWRPSCDLDEAMGDRPADFVFLMDKSKSTIIREAIIKKDWPCKLVAKWSNGWPHRLELFHKIYNDVDLLLINNKQYWEMTGRLPRTVYLPNGVDRDIFRVIRPITERPNRVLWVGAESRRRLKGYDTYLVPLQAELDRRGIDHDFRLVDSFSGQNRSAEEMVDWYNDGTILMCTSSSEGTPNPALEAAACGCTIVSTPVGNMPELIRNGVNGYLVKRELNSIIGSVAKATRKYPQLSTRMQRNIARWDWKYSAGKFFGLLRDLNNADAADEECTKCLNGARSKTPATIPSIAGKQQAVGKNSQIDLRDKVTAFVITCGESSINACMTCVEQQDAKTTIEILENLTPFSEAYKEMLARCKTPYFIQVDADMLLYPHAFKTLFKLITKAPSNTALLSAGLHDVHLDRQIHGIKIFNQKIAAAFPPVDGPRWHVQRNEEFERNGYCCERVPLSGDSASDTSILGLHGAFYNNQSIFKRYYKLQRDRRSHPLQLKWFDEYPSIFLDRYLSDPTQLNYCALMGVMAESFEEIVDDQQNGKAALEFGQDLGELQSLLMGPLNNSGSKPSETEGG